MFRIGFYITIVLLALGQLVSIGSTKFGALYLFDLAVLLWAMLAFFYALVSPRLRLIIPPNYMFFFSFLLWNLYVLSFSPYVGTYPGVFSVSAFYVVRLSAYLLFGLFLRNLVRARILTCGDVLHGLLFYTVLSVLFGFVQLLLYPDFSVFVAEGWDPHKNRLVGALFDPNFLGAVLVFGFNLILGLHTFTRARAHAFFYDFSLIALLLIGILLTFSRSAWLMLSISILAWGLLRYRKLLLISFLLGFASYLAVPRIQTRLSHITDPSDSAHFRLISWSNTLDAYFRGPLRGVGYNSFRFVQKDLGIISAGWGGHSGGGSDSSLLLVLATTGPVGLFLFLCFVLSPIFSFRRISANLWRTIYVATLPALLMESFFVNSLFYPQILFLWGVLLAFATFSYIEL